MDRLKITAIVGSLRKDSFNRQLALAAKDIIGAEADFEMLEYSDVPLFNGDIEYPPPQAVARVREIVKASDGIWFFTPEYNHSLPGVLKNLIDWLSRPEFKGGRMVLAKKCAAFSGITPGSFGTALAQKELSAVLSLLNMKLLNYPRVAVPEAEEQTDEEGKLKLTESLPFLEKQAKAFIKFIRDNKTRN